MGTKSDEIQQADLRAKGNLSEGPAPLPARITLFSLKIRDAEDQAPDEAGRQ
jgi:hypothetical protein